MRRVKWAGAVLLVGTAMLLAGCGGHSAERIVHKDPQTVYTQFDEMFAQAAEQGNEGSAAEHGQHTTVEGDPGKSLDVKVTIEGKPAIAMRFGFEPANGGAETRVTGDMDVDQDVLQASMRERAGNGARLTRIPDFAFGMMMQKMLDSFGQAIDLGMPPGGSQSVMAMATSPEMSSASAGERAEDAEQAQRAATAPTSSAAPMVDPNAAARDYLSQ